MPSLPSLPPLPRAAPHATVRWVWADLRARRVQAVLTVGVVAGVVASGVDLLGRGALIAAIGPCIGPCCFEVGGDVGERIGFVTRRAGDKAFVDLRAAVRAPSPASRARTIAS